MDILPLGIQFFMNRVYEYCLTVFKALEHMPTNQDAFLIFWRTTKLCYVAAILFHIYILYISTSQRSWLHITWFDSSHLGLWSVPILSTVRQVIELAFTCGYCKFKPRGGSCSPAALGKWRTGSLTHWGHVRIYCKSLVWGLLSSIQLYSLSS